MINIFGADKIKSYVQRRPNMIVEASLCVLKCDDAFLEELISAHARFGKTELEMRALFQDLSAYSDAVLPAVREILRMHADLLPFFQAKLSDADADYRMTVARGLAQGYPGPHWGVDTDEAVDALTERMLDAALSDVLEEDIPSIAHMEDPVGLIYQIEALDDAQKLLLIRFLSVRRQAVPQICAVLERIAAVLEAQYVLVQPAVERAYAQLAGEKDAFGQIMNAMRFQVTMPMQEADIYISIFGYNGITLNGFEGEPRFRVYCGLYVMELEKLSAAYELDSVSDLKAIADTTRWRMLRMLLKETLYLSEIAERLSLTPATVLHHLDLLINARLISLSTEDDGRKRRARYATNAENLNKIADKIRAVAMEVHHEQGEA